MPVRACVYVRSTASCFRKACRNMASRLPCPCAAAWPRKPALACYGGVGACGINSAPLFCARVQLARARHLA
jgi:hypothetical protein